MAALGLVLHFSVLCCLKPFLHLLTLLWKKKLFVFYALCYGTSVCGFGTFQIVELKQPVIWMGNWLFCREYLYPTQPNSTSLWFSPFVYFNGLIKVNFCHLSDFTLMVVHLVKVIQDSMCVLVWNAPTKL